MDEFVLFLKILWRVPAGQTTRKRILFGCQQHNPSTCQVAVAEHWGIFLNYQKHPQTPTCVLIGTDSVMWECDLTMCCWDRPLWSHVSDSPWADNRQVLPEAAGTAGITLVYKIFRTRVARIDSHGWFMSQITMGWGHLSSWAKPSALFPQFRIYTLTNGNIPMS